MSERLEPGGTVPSTLMPPHAKTGAFSAFARWTERQVGRSATFVLACGIVLVWGASGPFFGFSDTWQLVINTGTTIITFLMVFVIQSTQSRDTRAIHLKLDELIRCNQLARNSMINLEELSEEDIDRIKTAFATLVGEQAEPEPRAQRSPPQAA